MTDQPQLRSVRLTRVFNAPIDLVFRAWAEARHVTRWMKCGQDVKLTLDNWEPAVGGEFTTRMEKPGQWSATTTGRFVEVDPPHLLVYRTDPNPSLGTPELTVRVELTVVDDGTLLTLTHSGIPTDDLCGIIEAGWTASLGVMGDLVGAQESAR